MVVWNIADIQNVSNLFVVWTISVPFNISIVSDRYDITSRNRQVLLFLYLVNSFKGNHATTIETM